MSDNQDDTVELTFEGTDAGTPGAGASGAGDPVASDAADAGAPGAGASGAGDPAVREEGPRTRWAGIIWGLAFAALGVIALKAVLTPAWSDAVYDWTVNLTPLSIVAGVLLVLGAVLLLTGLVGLAHRLQQLSRHPR